MRKDPRPFFVVIVLFLAGVLSWFSWTTIHLDVERELNRRQAEAARAKAELQERIGYALWRMDWLLTPLVAQEAARTHWMYQSFMRVPSESGSDGQYAWPSPLLMQPSPFVVLHFQIDQDGQVSSPQSPPEAELPLVVACGVPPDSLADNQQRLKEVTRFCEFKPLWDECSDRKLPDIAGAEQNWLIPNSSGWPTVAAQGISAEPAQQTQLFGNRAIGGPGEVPAPGPLLMDDTAQQKAPRYDQREASANEYAFNQWRINRLQPTAVEDRRVYEGVMRPLWIDDRLILARRVESAGRAAIQCCWLDWPAIREWLLDAIREIVPDSELVPQRETDRLEYSRALATLPVELVIHRHREDDALEPDRGQASKKWLGLLEHPPSRPVCLSLTVAWGGFLLAAASAAWLMLGVVRLSERRAAFVSAVTHELRTPLTTFRLYSEMLNNQMIDSEQQRQLYTAGLVSESDRLSRLVDNVLQFARLERQSPQPPNDSITAGELVDRVAERCRARAVSAGMNLAIEIEDTVRQVPLVTSIDAVDQIVFNLVDNACKYAKRKQADEVQLAAELDGTWLVISVRDFGPGIDKAMIKRLFRPFSRSADETAGTAAGVGLGLALAKQLAQQLGGRLQFSAANPGCRFSLRLKLHQRQPH
ncbi:MAG TPA: HAMP domain-containing sensor histidine kinase [Pirellulaceae bacterium]|nr:HAMP domain-containing sensor histidine kinase [Pirellulaceae bacterium]